MTVKASDLQLDTSLYPRGRESPSNVTALADALAMGATLPPVIVWDETLQVIDGFHRVRAYRRHFADLDIEIPVEWCSYESKADAFADAVALNSTHGKRLAEGDYGRIVERAKQLGMTEEAVSVLMKVPVGRLQKRSSTGTPTKARGSQVSRGERVAAVRREDAHDGAVTKALQDLALHMEPGREAGPGHLPVVLAAVKAARESGGEDLREVLLEAASLFVWWAARTR